MQTFVREIMKKCVLGLHETCVSCGECENRCEMDIQKICDNCFRCLEPKEDFAKIEIDAIYTNMEMDVDHDGEG